jgi:hypothetical protein
MVITLRYENVPHFCFSCGWIDHAAADCDDIVEVQGVVYGEELRASPPRCTKEIMVKPSTSRVVRPLFHVTGMPMRGHPEAGRNTGGGTTSETRNQSQRIGEAEEVSKQDGTCEKFVNIIKELHAACNLAKASWTTQGSACKERVSFGTNRTTEDECSDGGLVDQKMTAPIVTTPSLSP